MADVFRLVLVVQDVRLDLTPYLPTGAREFVPEREDRAAWARWQAFRRRLELDVNPHDTVEPDDVAEVALRRPEPFYESRHLVLEGDQEVVSTLFLSAVLPGSPEYDGNRHLISADIKVLPERRRQGLASSWLPAIAAYAASRGARLVSLDAAHEDGHAFLAWLGAEARLREWESRLWLDRADWDRIREWSAIDAGYMRLERYDPFPPEAIWESYSRDYTELTRHVPREDLEKGDWILTPERMREHRARLAEQRRTLHVLAAFDGEGMSALTEIIRSEHDPAALDQELTAVHPRARRRGLARFLKARLLLDLRDRYAEARFVRTWNAGSNDTMWAINQAMGFERYRQWVAYQVEVDQLRDRIGQTSWWPESGSGTGGL